MSVSFRACAMAIVCAALCASAINGQSLGNWSDYIALQQAVCATNGPSYKVCGNGACYCSDSQVCVQSNGIFNVCPNYANALCGQQCYSPTSSVCLRGDNGAFYVQPLGYQLCGTQGFDPRYQICANNSGSLTVCWAGAQICGTQCYDKSAYVCNSTLGLPVLCPIGTSLCNTGECYSPSTHSCMSYSTGNNLVMYSLCPKNYKLCGSKCYHPKLETCLNPGVTNQVCPVNGVICNTFSGPSCYDPLLQNCTKLPSGFSILCPINNLYCMVTNGWYTPLQGQCYDPATAQCINDGPYTLVCPKGQSTCNGNCYIPSSSSCLAVTDNYRVVCSLNTELCVGVQGAQCYDPNSNVCASSGNYTMVCDKQRPNICPNGQCCAYSNRDLSWAS